MSNKNSSIERATMTKKFNLLLCMCLFPILFTDAEMSSNDNETTDGQSADANLDKYYEEGTLKENERQDAELAAKNAKKSKYASKIKISLQKRISHIQKKLTPIANKIKDTTKEARGYLIDTKDSITHALNRKNVDAGTDNFKKFKSYITDRKLSAQKKAEKCLPLLVKLFSIAFEVRKRVFKQSNNIPNQVSAISRAELNPKVLVTAKEPRGAIMEYIKVAKLYNQAMQLAKKNNILQIMKNNYDQIAQVAVCHTPKCRELLQKLNNPDLSKVLDTNDLEDYRKFVECKSLITKFEFEFEIKQDEDFIKSKLQKNNLQPPSLFNKTYDKTKRMLNGLKLINNK